MSWSAHQQAMLEAMGYTLWRAAGPTPTSTSPRVETTPPPRVESTPPPRVESTPPPRTTITDGGDPLLRALRRAAGGRDPSALLPPLEQLRGDARAKRALWPRLRALRRH